MAAVLSCTLGLLVSCGSEKESTSSVGDSAETVDIKTGNEESSSAESSSAESSAESIASDKDSSKSSSSSSDKEEQPEIIDVGVKPGESGKQEESSSAENESSSVPEGDSSAKESESSSGDKKPADGSFSDEDFSVSLNNNRLSCGDDFLPYVDKMGKKARTEQGQACLEGGYDTNYYYDSDLTVFTIAKGGKQIIYDIYITGAAFPNDRGVTVGKTTREEVCRIYGTPSSELPAADNYVSGKKMLSFEYENDVVTGIAYSDTSVN